MAFSYPATCDTPPKRVEFVTRAIERLRLVHNRMGKWRTQGISQAEYDTLPAQIRSAVAYKAELLTAEEWQRFREQWYLPREKRVLAERDSQWAALRGLLKDRTTWDADIDEDALATDEAP